MKTPEYPIKKLERVKKIEQEPDVPIIDVVRHGSAKGIQGESKKNENLNISDPNFKLDEKHLDLTAQGIAEIKASIQELSGVIDKKNEIVLIVASPAWRTHSSALVAEEVLRHNGIEVLNTQGEVKLFSAIDQMQSHEKRIAIKNYGNYSLETQVNQSEDIQKQTSESENLGFQRFLRHMNNIYDFLNPKTLEKLKGKKLRIITFAHAETTGNFIQEAIPEAAYQNKGQILEITPKSKLRKDEKVDTYVKVYKTTKNSGKEAKIKRGFEPKE